MDTYCNDNTTNHAMVNFYSQIWSNAEALGAAYDASTGKRKGSGLMTGSSGGDLTFTPSADGKTIDATVTVTNTGDVAGKEVVQVYFQSEYTDYDRQNGIEKAAVELCGFDKTALLEPGASETVTITVDKEEFRTYDTYIMDEGDYYLTIGTDAHDALNNIRHRRAHRQPLPERRSERLRRREHEVCQPQRLEGHLPHRQAGADRVHAEGNDRHQAV